MTVNLPDEEFNSLLASTQELSSSTDNSIPTTSSSNVKPNPKKRTRAKMHETEDLVLKSISKTLDNIRENNNENGKYGDCVGMQLDSISQRSKMQAAYCRKLISDVLFLGETEQLSSNWEIAQTSTIN